MFYGDNPPPVGGPIEGPVSDPSGRFERLTTKMPPALPGDSLLSREEVEGGVASLKKATELDPNNGAAQNMLGYAALRPGDAEGAVAAFNEYIRIAPQEPNAQDSLGEALLAAGRFKDAEGAFQKGLDLSPQFFSALEGIAADNSRTASRATFAGRL